jgi:hypothetical protein
MWLKVTLPLLRLSAARAENLSFSQQLARDHEISNLYPSDDYREIVRSTSDSYPAPENMAFSDVGFRFAGSRQPAVAGSIS